MFTQIRWRLVGWSMLVLGLILLLLGAAVYLTLARSLMNQVDQELIDYGQQLAANMHELSESAIRLDREGYRGGYFSLIATSDGRLLANPQQVKVSSTLLSQIDLDDSPEESTIALDGAPTRVYIRPLADRGLPGAFLVVGQSLVPEENTLGRLILVLVGGGVVGLLLSFAGAWFLAGRALVPIQLAFRRQHEFVADASHELRTPLSVLRAATDLLNQRREEPLETNGQLFDDVRFEIVRLERLAGDLLTLARSDVDELDLAVGDVDLVPFVADVARRVRPLADKRRIELTSHGDPGPMYVEGDPDRLQQVLLILLDNSLKHTPPGGHVDLRVRRHGGDAILQVVDDGEGIAPEHLPQIFDRFYRADRSRSRSEGSTGLGLPIAQSLIVAHGGQLNLTSSPGMGTTATIRLRLLPQEHSLADKLGHLAARVVHRTAVE